MCSVNVRCTCALVQWLHCQLADYYQLLCSCKSCLKYAQVTSIASRSLTVHISGSQSQQPPQSHGRRLRGRGAVPPKFEVGDGPCIRPPNICYWKRGKVRTD